MRTPAEYEAEIDKLGAALDLEAKARASMAEAAANAFEEIARLRSGIAEVRDYVHFWSDDEITRDKLSDLIASDPKARGEQSLPLEV